MASLQILEPFTSCYHTCNTNDPSFVIGSCQVRFVVVIFDHSATTYSALDGIYVSFKVSGRVCLLIGEIICGTRPSPTLFIGHLEEYPLKFDCIKLKFQKFLTMFWISGIVSPV